MSIKFLVLGGGGILGLGGGGGSADFIFMGARIFLKNFFPREKGEMVFVEGFSFKMAVFPFSRGKNRISQEVENRASLISVPLALRVYACNDF